MSPRRLWLPGSSDSYQQCSTASMMCPLSSRRRGINSLRRHPGFRTMVSLVSHVSLSLRAPCGLSDFDDATQRSRRGPRGLQSHDVASPASVSVHSIASIVEPGLGGGPTLALLRTLSQAEFTSPSPSRRLMEDWSCSSSFLLQHCCCFLHCLPLSLSSTAFHAHVAAVLPANISGLSR